MASQTLKHFFHFSYLSSLFSDSDIGNKVIRTDDEIAMR